MGSYIFKDTGVDFRVIELFYKCLLTYKEDEDLDDLIKKCEKNSVEIFERINFDINPFYGTPMVNFFLERFGLSLEPELYIILSLVYCFKCNYLFKREEVITSCIGMYHYMYNIPIKYKNNFKTGVIGYFLFEIKDYIEGKKYHLLEKFPHFKSLKEKLSKYTVKIDCFCSEPKIIFSTFPRKTAKRITNKDLEHFTVGGHSIVGVYGNNLIKIQNPFDAIYEIHFLRKLNHPNIIRIYDILVVDKYRIGILLPFKGHDLHTLITKGVQLNKIRIIRQLLNVLNYLHDDIGIVHHDIKPQNILYNEEKLKITLIDFGISAYKHQRTFPCTYFYRPPEFLTEHIDLKYYTGLVDIWATGCVFLEMIKGKPYFQREHRLSVDDTFIARVNYIVSTKQTKHHPMIWDMITMPESRLSAKQLLEKYF